MNTTRALLTIILVTVPSQIPAEDVGDNLLDLLRVPMVTFAGCESSISELLGSQTEHTTTMVENRHNPWLTDYRHTVQSGTASVVFYEITEISRCLLEQVDISGPQETVHLPIGVGATRQTVIQKIGQPSREYPDVDFYLVENEIGADDVIIRYGDGKVKSITWIYFID